MKRSVIASMKIRSSRHHEFGEPHYTVTYRARPKYDAIVCQEIPFTYLRETIVETLQDSGKHLCEIERDMAGYRRSLAEFKRRRGYKWDM